MRVTSASEKGEADAKGHHVYILARQSKRDQVRRTDGRAEEFHPRLMFVRGAATWVERLEM